MFFFLIETAPPEISALPPPAALQISAPPAGPRGPPGYPATVPAPSAPAAGRRWPRAVPPCARTGTAGDGRSWRPAERQAPAAYSAGSGSGGVIGEVSWPVLAAGTGSPRGAPRRPPTRTPPRARL